MICTICPEMSGYASIFWRVNDQTPRAAMRTASARTIQRWRRAAWIRADIMGVDSQLACPRPSFRRERPASAWQAAGARSPEARGETRERGGEGLPHVQGLEQQGLQQDGTLADHLRPGLQPIADLDQLAVDVADLDLS